jgi:hypothetical protein
MDEGNLGNTKGHITLIDFLESTLEPKPKAEEDSTSFCPNHTPVESNLLLQYFVIITIIFLKTKEL